MTGQQLAEFYVGLGKDFPIFTLEDPFGQDGGKAWPLFTEKVGGPTQVVGDDLAVTNVDRAMKAIEDKACNALLLKVNQFGSLPEAIDAVTLGQKSDWGVMSSHRSGACALMSATPSQQAS